MCCWLFSPLLQFFLLRLRLRFVKHNCCSKIIDTDILLSAKLQELSIWFLSHFLMYYLLYNSQHSLTFFTIRLLQDGVHKFKDFWIRKQQLKYLFLHKIPFFKKSQWYYRNLQNGYYTKQFFIHFHLSNVCLKKKLKFSLNTIFFLKYWNFNHLKLGYQTQRNCVCIFTVWI